MSAAAATLRERLDGFEDNLPNPIKPRERNPTRPAVLRLLWLSVVDVRGLTRTVRAFCASRAPAEEAPSTCFDDYSR